MHKNSEGYSDPTAGKAIGAADKPPEVVSWLIKTFKEIASLMGYEIVGRVTLRARKIKRAWR